jgi:ADP-ribosylglycohydrolase/tetratricopeptide (TPR) repeat protein/protein-tyrosine phosphatase
MEIKSSQSHPIRVDFIKSEQFPILNRLGMTFAPGKKQSDGLTGAWDRDLRTDLERLFNEFGTGTLISLVEDDELEELKITNLEEECDRAMINLVRFPIRDVSVPDSMEDFVLMIAVAVDSLKQGETVVTHCKGGLGRAGTTAACIAVAATDAEISASDAIKLVRQARPGTVETEAQEQFVAEFEKEWRDIVANRGDDYLLYWQERSIQDHASNDWPLDVIASNQLMTVAPGDTLWIVTLTQERELVLAGRLAVGEVVEYEEAIRRMPAAGLWQAEYYAFPEPGTEEYIREIDIHDLAEDLRFDSENDRLVLRDGKINPQQFQSMRKLTRQSVEMLEEAFYTIGPFAADELEPETMLDLARQVVEMMPDDGDAQYNLGVALGRNELHSEAIDAYRLALELGYETPVFAYFNIGATLIELGSLNEAIAEFNSAILSNYDFAPAHFMLGVAYGEVGRYEEAILATQAGLDIEPDDPNAHFNIGRFYYLQGDFLSACGYFDNTIAIAPDSFRAFYLKGRCHGKLGEIDAEIECYKDALEIAPDLVDAMFALGAAWAIRQCGSAEGIEYLETDGVMELQNPTHQFYLALCTLALGANDLMINPIDLRNVDPSVADRLEAFLDDRSPAVSAEGRTSPVSEKRERKERTAVTLAFGNETFTAKNIPDLYQQILKFLVESGEINNIELPFATGPKRYLIACEPIHPSGQNFMAPVEYKGYFMEAHNNRTAAIANLEKLTNALGNGDIDVHDQESALVTDTETISIDFSPEYRPTPLVLTPDEETILDKFKGCLLTGAVGDALGAAVEFDSLDRIRGRFGEAGLTDYALAYGRIGAITDDTQMTLFTAEGLIRAYMRYSEKGICHPPSVIHKAYLRWLHTQSVDVSNDDRETPDYLRESWLIDLSDLNIRRAPGNTCLSALRSGVMGTIDEPINDSKGCGGAMRVAPVGLLVWDDPFNLAAEAAAITHGHPAGYLSAGVLAVIVNKIIEGSSLGDAVDHAVYKALPEVKDHKETFEALDKAIRLAQDRTKAPSAALVESLGGGWVGEEALAIAIYCSLVYEDDLYKALLLAVNHSGDSDSTGAITGNILGALHGMDAIPSQWLNHLELRAEIEQVAVDLHAASLGVNLWDRYPG